VKIKAYKNLVGKPDGKRSLWEPKSRWEDNVQMDLKERGCDSVEWIQMTQDRAQL
jgi:hypothetical protein